MHDDIGNSELSNRPPLTPKAASLVEACLTLPLLFVLVSGAAEFSRVAYTSLEVVSAAKAGVAYGAQSGGPLEIQTASPWQPQQTPANVPGLTVLTPTSSYVCSDGSASTGQPSDCSSSHIVQTLTVTTQVSSIR